VVELVFHTPSGPVQGTAEMLMPITSMQQPFRYLTLPESDERTLQAAFQSGAYRNIDEEERIEELRAAVANWNPCRRRGNFVAHLLVGLVALAACLICAH
jgi:hypothetical protein